MTHRYKRQCWNCGSQNLEPDSRGVRCRDCGATWNELPESHLVPVVEETTAIQLATGEIRYSRYRPSGTVQRRAARTQQGASK